MPCYVLTSVSWLFIAMASNVLLSLLVYVTVGLLLRYLFDLSIIPIAVSLLAIYLSTAGWKILRLLWLVGPRDFKAFLSGISVLVNITRCLRNNITVSKVFDKTVLKYPHKPFILYQDCCWTFNEAQKYSYQVANFLHETGFRHGDVIALFSENCLEYIPVWLGMSRIGVVAALVNYNLKDLPLTHCLQAANCKAVIVAGNLANALMEIKTNLPQSMKYYVLNGDKISTFPIISFDEGVEKSPVCEPPAIQTKVSDVLFYIYTSGTTGLPKAAIISHVRFLSAGFGFSKFFNCSSNDVIYICLPLYHASAGLLGACLAVVTGVTLALRTKFSASHFWEDCVKYKANMALYIGEICRYLLAQPTCPEETQHRIRLMMGNGIKPQIWKQFQERFHVAQIGEFYGSTEGNCAAVNINNTVGSVGFMPKFLPVAQFLVKVNPETNELIRNKNGLCIKCQSGEAGQMVGLIPGGSHDGKFDGYVDATATSKKIVHDVLKKGDAAFISGDILVMDELGNLYFQDRIGDTYRWRGENVSTGEVEVVISKALKLTDVVVYGVEIPGIEGRAGMAALVDIENSIDVSQLGTIVAKSLAPYARPIFLRLIKEADITGTYKLKKTKLRDEGFDINNVKDRMYFLSPKSRQYEPLTPGIYKIIMEGKVRL